MSRDSIFKYLQDVSPAIAIEAVYLAGHQLAHPNFSLLEAEIPNNALNEADKSIAKALASDLLAFFVDDKKKLISQFNDHDRNQINRKIRGFIRENIIDNSEAAKLKADEFLDNMAA